MWFRRRQRLTIFDDKQPIFPTPAHEETPPFTAHVPGKGLVNWPVEKIDAYAIGTMFMHQPIGGWWRRHRVYEICLDDVVWPCPSFEWSRTWVARLARERKATQS